MLSEAFIKLTEILNPFLSQSFSFFNFTLLNSSNRTPAEPLGN
jgi:hypothetical protein